MLSLRFKKVTIATTFAAFAGTALGTGVASAAEPSSGISFGSSSGELAQLSSTLFGSSKPAPENPENPEAPEGSGLIEKVEDVEGLTEPLSAEQAKEVLNGSFVAKKNDKIGLSFQPDGTVGVSDGCNLGNGTYSIAEDTGALEIKDVITTMKACEPDVMVDVHDFNVIVPKKPQVYSIDDTTIALVKDGQAIQFVKVDTPEEK
ncbi:MULTISPECIES: META domain-containing protein [Corynebacterium]|uniref:META domain-containing protein n=2 Tax=Corynebacterium TaxID=1716 RepID=A0A553FSR3_9CORY|nr:MULTISPECIES: META domain-containing protein [Corynebacterium]OFK64094.1 hypothetical protein HMPREF2807_01790 [Corynebacterium sp. HMSC074A09]OFO20491.1 hypothetical protein HMPREF3056_01340 [Corynebacterium sp. HMSC056F09]OFO98344.1 hypothetical protein HMPREF3009_02715 [Corynebacterium sp. HMSC034H07]OHO54976.1 hypothetical protein HMPREF2635_06390 [Corynebacterium sp. HMSC035E02]TRX60282.1 META domain-containing protein [Corynebacterium aurimucosum]